MEWFLVGGGVNVNIKRPVKWQEWEGGASKVGVLGNKRTIIMSRRKK